MNATIKDILRRSGKPYCEYAARRIESLEASLRAIAKWSDLSDDTAFLINAFAKFAKSVTSMR